ncbi:MAG: hypothetical protein FLDDKLPJ_03572 [Phycisphaerae bacterium]|nr:hypothetical protein [Phycisphaerae bacterium]
MPLIILQFPHLLSIRHSAHATKVEKENKIVGITITGTRYIGNSPIAIHACYYVTTPK